MSDAEARAEHGYAQVEEIEQLERELRRLREENAALRAVLQRADSRLSLLRHRGGIPWGTLGIGDAAEVDAVIGEARRLLEPPGGTR